MSGQRGAWLNAQEPPERAKIEGGKLIAACDRRSGRSSRGRR